MNRTIKIVLLVAIPALILISIIAGWLGERSVTSLHNFGCYSMAYSWSEQEGEHQNLAELYVCNGPLDIDTLQRLCSKKKRLYEHGKYSSYTLVVFADKNSVCRSNNPITALYGDELEKLQHIIAFYSYVPSNGYSQLEYYAKNAAESMSKEIKVQ